MIDFGEERLTGVSEDREYGRESSELEKQGMTTAGSENERSFAFEAGEEKKALEVCWTNQVTP